MERKATGRPTVNAAQMWAYFTTSVYTSGDLPVIATREALQNAADAIRAAVRSRQLGAKDGFFEVLWDPNSRVLSWRDNGIGMSTDTIVNKFLSLGDSGKSDAIDSDQAAGGFGVAKAVILGLSPSFKWELRSRDNHAISGGAREEIAIYDAPNHPGTQITVYDVPAKFDSRYSYARDRHEPLLERLRIVLAANDLPDIAISLNGENVKPLFSRRGGSRVADGGNWGNGTSAIIRAYRRPPGQRGGAFYVRLGGLFQFDRSSNAKLPADVVVDLATTVRPGSSGYPLNAARDQLQAEASWAMQEVIREIEKENESAGHEQEYEVFLPDSGGPISQATQEALSDPQLQTAMQDAAGGLSDYYRELSMISRVEPPPTSAAPIGSRLEPPDDGAGALAERIVIAESAGNGLAGAVHTVRKLLTDAGQLGVSVDAALERTAAGDRSPDDLLKVGDALDSASKVAMEQAIGVGGGGLLQANAAQRAMAPLERLLPPAHRRSPFGQLAGLRVSKTHYDRSKASRFRRDFAKWIPYLVVWDAALRLVAAEGRIRSRFTPGFVLDDSCNGLAAKEATPTGEKRAVIYVHPDTLKAVVLAHKHRPLSIAYWLHGLACHELSHLDGRMGDGHSENFITAREELGFATSHLLIPISELVTRVLSLRATGPARKTGGSTARRLAVQGLAELDSLLQKEPPSGTTSKDIANVMRRLRPNLVENLESLITQQLTNRSR